jgi:hypothetical protein
MPFIVPERIGSSIRVFWPLPPWVSCQGPIVRETDAFPLGREASMEARSGLSWRRDGHCFVICALAVAYVVAKTVSQPFVLTAGVGEGVDVGDVAAEPVAEVSMLFLPSRKACTPKAASVSGTRK